MKFAIRPRLRAPVVLLAGALVPVVVGGDVYGWASALFVAPVVIAAAVGFYVLGGSEGDVGAAVRHQHDERQADHRLRMQALVGRVMALAVAVAYTVAVATRTTLWPYALLLAVLAAAIVAGWFRYGEHHLGRNQ